MAGQTFLKLLVLAALWVAIYFASKKNSSFFEELIGEAEKVALSGGELRLLKGSILYYLLFFGFLFSFAILGWIWLFYALLLLLAIDGAILIYASRHMAADFLSGIIIACKGELKVGDILDLGSAGEKGKVEKVSLLGIRLATQDGRLMTIPNSQLARGSYAVLPSGSDKTITVTVTIKESEAAGSAIELLRRTGQEYERRDKEKAIEVNLAKASEDSATLTLSLGVKADDYCLAKSELQLALISALKSQNIRFASISAE